MGFDPSAFGGWGMFKRLLAISIYAALGSCAPSGYHYEGFTQVPNDPCWTKELQSPGAIATLNNSIADGSGLPSQVAAITNLRSANHGSLADYGFRFTTNAGSVLCHATLTFANGSTESGVVSFNDPGAYARVQVKWVSDITIAAARARSEGLYSPNRKLLVTPDLQTPSVQQCVGRATAFGVGEEFYGQLWAACADPRNPITRWN